MIEFMVDRSIANRVPAKDAERFPMIQSEKSAEAVRNAHPGDAFRRISNGDLAILTAQYTWRTFDAETGRRNGEWNRLIDEDLIKLVAVDEIEAAEAAHDESKKIIDILVLQLDWYKRQYSGGSTDVDPRDVVDLIVSNDVV